MEATQLIEYLRANRDAFPGKVDLGGGTRVANSQNFLKSHLEVMEDPATTAYIREVHLLRLQRFYDAVTIDKLTIQE